jgi:hypothetical protein
MPTKQEIRERISNLLNEKTGGEKPCVVCGRTAWVISDLYIRSPATRDPNNFNYSGTGFPLQPIICAHCGNTHLINLLVLGIKNEDMVSIIYPDEDASKK